MRPSSDFETTLLTREQCLSRLSLASVGRIGVSIDALPVILPTQFDLDGESVVFRVVPDPKLDAAVADAVVAFQVDAPEQFGGLTWWSVLIQGIARPLGGQDDGSSPRPLASIGPPAMRLRIESATMRGCLFEVGATTDPTRAGN